MLILHLKFNLIIGNNINMKTVLKKIISLLLSRREPTLPHIGISVKKM